MTTLTTASYTEASPNSQLQKWLSAPLITGASVSADWASLSPGKKLALRYTDSRNILTVAQGGRPGVETIKSVRSAKLADRSIIIAVDFFFWDSTLPAPDASLKALDELVEKASAQKIPVVLGEIPALLPASYQPQRERLNEEIAARCAQYAKCFVMPFDQLHRQIMSDGYWLVKGKKLTIKQIVPDGLHLSQSAGDALADKLESVLESRGGDMIHL